MQRLKPAVLVLAVVSCFQFVEAAAEVSNVGYRRFEASDPADGAKIQGGLWFPTAARMRPTRLGLHEVVVALDAAPITGHYPLIAISHGSGGSGLDHYDTALVLAQEGFVVATFNHPYDNFADKSGVGTSLQLISRPRHIRAVIDQVLGSPAFGAILDPKRIGVFGFSAGGFAGLVAVGGVPDTSRFGAYCAAAPDDGFACPRGARPASFPAVDWRGLAEPRIAAAVLAAPALGFLFDDAGLADVRIPLLLFQAESDRVLRAPYHVEPIARSLPKPIAPIVIPKADHYVFLAPCSAALEVEAAGICADPPGVDRVALHEKMNAEIVAFFRRSFAAP